MRTTLLALLLMCLSLSVSRPAWAQAGIPGILPLAEATPAPVKRDRPLRIVATTGVLADVTRQLAGDLAVVTSMVPAGADLHTFEPTTDSVKELATADLVIVNGLGLEGWMDKVVANSGFKGRVVVASEGVEPIASSAEADHDHDAAEHEHHDHGGGVDPHAWTDVMAVSRYAVNIRAALVQADGYNAAEYESRGEVYNAQLKVLHNWVLRETSRLTPEQRILIMDHDAMAYFAQRYGFTVKTLRGASTREEPNAHNLAEVADFMRQYGVRSIYVESSGSQRLAEQLARETGARIGEPLLVHSPAPAGEPGDTYIAMTMLNVFRLVRGTR